MRVSTSSRRTGRGRHRGELDHLLRDPALGLGPDDVGEAVEGRLVGAAADEDALAARLARRLEHELGAPGQRRLALRLVGHEVRRHVVEDRLLAEVEADHLRHVVVDRLVVGDAGAQRVGDRDGPRATGAYEARDAEQRVGPELERVEEVVVEAAVHGVHAAQPGRRAHVEHVVAHTRARQDPRDEVRRERPVLDRPLLARGVEGDALLQEDRVAAVGGSSVTSGPDRVGILHPDRGAICGRGSKSRHGSLYARSSPA
jgi:hypothetical protein